MNNVCGHTNPTLDFIRESVTYFRKYGFNVAIGPELETEWYNFDFLRVIADHPSRDTQDTFWAKNKKVLRTQTSSVQGRVTHDWGYKPPIRVVSPGRVFRNEATDSSHEAVFHQLEGFVIDKDISMANLIFLINDFIRYTFGAVKTKFYPHNFPYVEPGMEVAIEWKGKWMEVLGCGMIHPEVLKNMGIDSNKYQGIAFGLGADRFAMLKTDIDDIRLLYHPDYRMISQL